MNRSWAAFMSVHIRTAETQVCTDCKRTRNTQTRRTVPEKTAGSILTPRTSKFQNHICPHHCLSKLWYQSTRPQWEQINPRFCLKSDSSPQTPFPSPLRAFGPNRWFELSLTTKNKPALWPLNNHPNRCSLHSKQEKKWKKSKWDVILYLSLQTVIHERFGINYAHECFHIY